MPTLEELIPQFHKFIAVRAETYFTEKLQQEIYPEEVGSNLMDHYLGLASSALNRVGIATIVAHSEIDDPKQRDIEDAIADFDHSLLNTLKGPKESYNNWVEAIADLLEESEFKKDVRAIIKKYNRLMEENTLNKTPYDNTVEALKIAYGTALRMIYRPPKKI